MRYGQPPAPLAMYSVECKEMLFYQYLPIKMIGEFYKPVYEDRLSCFNELIGAICCDYIGVYGLDSYMASYVYMTAKYLYNQTGCPFNRPGWHCDGFMTDDINYVWSDNNPTEFNCSDFALSQDDELSLSEMQEQANPYATFCYEKGTLIRLNQFNVHRVAEGASAGMRTFLKVSFSKDKYDLLGNSHNYLMDYNWEMKPRKESRNIPQNQGTNFQRSVANKD